MPNLLRVSLDKTTTPWSVDIDQSGNANHVPRNAAAQTITWQLVGNAATGSYVSFQWQGTGPPNGVFGPFTPDSSNSSRATMSDLNNTQATSGTWIYKLTIEVDGVEYSVIISLTETNTNLTIKNN